MPNYDLIEGIRLALSKGYTLEQAMMSFYNAGYPKEEIEEAARILLYHPSQILSHPEKPIPGELKQPIKALPFPAPRVQSPAEIEKQRVSKYEEGKTVNNIAIISLIFILFLVFACLAGIWIFKDELINFFARIFQ